MNIDIDLYVAIMPGQCLVFSHIVLRLKARDTFALCLGMFVDQRRQEAEEFLFWGGDGGEKTRGLLLFEDTMRYIFLHFG